MYRLTSYISKLLFNAIEPCVSHEMVSSKALLAQRFVNFKEDSGLVGSMGSMHQFSCSLSELNVDMLKILSW